MTQALPSIASSVSPVRADPLARTNPTEVPGAFASVFAGIEVAANAAAQSQGAVPVGAVGGALVASPTQIGSAHAGASDDSADEPTDAEDEGVDPLVGAFAMQPPVMQQPALGPSPALGGGMPAAPGIGTSPAGQGSPVGVDGATAGGSGLGAAGQASDPAASPKTPGSPQSSQADTLLAASLPADAKAAPPKAPSKPQTQSPGAAPATPLDGESRVAAATPVNPADDAALAQGQPQHQPQAASLKPRDPHQNIAPTGDSFASNVPSANQAAGLTQPLPPVQGTAALVAPQSAAAPTPAVPIEGLAVEIAARALEGKRRFEIRLDPPELGRIDVRLDIGRDGQVTSRLVVERAETLDLLRRDAAALERALQSTGLRTDDSGLQFSLRDQQQRAHPAWPDDRPRASVLIVPDEDVAVREAVRRGYGVLRGLGRGVDIRI